jgi:hypothetical protein
MPLPWKRIRTVLIVVGVVCFAWFVWPTPYRYLGFLGGKIPCRVNIFTDEVSCFYGEWEPY